MTVSKDSYKQSSPSLIGPMYIFLKESGKCEKLQQRQIWKVQSQSLDQNLL